MLPKKENYNISISKRNSRMNVSSIRTPQKSQILPESLPSKEQIENQIEILLILKNVRSYLHKQKSEQININQIIRLNIIELTDLQSLPIYKFQLDPVFFTQPQINKQIKEYMIKLLNSFSKKYEYNVEIQKQSQTNMAKMEEYYSHLQNLQKEARDLRLAHQKQRYKRCQKMAENLAKNTELKKINQMLICEKNFHQIRLTSAKEKQKQQNDLIQTLQNQLSKTRQQITKTQLQVRSIKLEGKYEKKNMKLLTEATIIGNNINKVLQTVKKDFQKNSKLKKQILKKKIIESPSATFFR